MKLLPGFATFDDVFDNMFDDPFFRGTRTTNLMKTDVKEIGGERYSGSCSRSFYVGDDIKQEDIKASYNNGELIITLPKNAPKEIDTSSKYIPID